MTRRSVVGLVVLVLWMATAAVALAAQPLAVPAEFVRDIKMPGTGETILRPSSLHYDKYHDEVLVGDPGNNRVIIFGANGVFKFSFALNGIMTTPRDIATDPEGYIYVLGSDKVGQVLNRFDFDGQSLGRIAIPREIDGLPVTLRTLACDDNGLLYALDHQGRRILVIDGSDTVLRTIVVEQDAQTIARRVEGETAAAGEGAFALGTLTCANDVLYVPVSNAGTVYTFSTAGEYLGAIGSFGAKTGFLNFPVAVEVTPEGLIMVLDRPRYCVVCYTADNEFLGEFGGKGISPGWFMGPSLLAAPAPDRVIVGQVFRNKIQVCTVPDFIRTKLVQNSTESTTPAVSVSVVSRDGEFPSSTSKGAHVARIMPYPEVSE